MAVETMSISLRNAKEYIQRFLKIRTKSGKLVPLRFNPPQKKLYEAVAEQARAGRPIRLIILKARQMGFSTMTGGLIFHRTATRELVESLVVAHQEDATANLFSMYRLFYEELPAEIQPLKKASNAQEILFENPTKNPEEKRREPGLRSRIRCATAGGRGVGRSFTVKNAHLSEFAFWPGRKLVTYAGIMQSIPDQADTMVVIESTANGYDEFKDLWDDSVEAWQRGEHDGFLPVFFAWWEMPEYRRPVPADFQLTPEEAEIKDTYGLDDEQISWRRWCIRNNCGGDLDLFHQEYPASPDEAFIASGRCVFKQQAVILCREQARRREKRTGRFVYDYDGAVIRNIRWTDAWDGEISIYTTPRIGYPYVIGADTAGEGSDFFVGQVLDNTTGEQVAVLRQENGEGEFVRQLYCLGLHYNGALLGVEANFSTFPNAELERLGYRNLYVREALDTYTGKIRQSFGFRTDSISRPRIISELVEISEHHMELINDYDTLGEMLTFVRNEAGRAEAQEGKHDDCVMALAIAHHIRPQQDYLPARPEPEGVTWDASMWEDYNNASKAEKEYLVKKWGRPKK